MLSDSEANELCRSSGGSTKNFYFQRTMYRIKDPRQSLPFYSEVLGMTLLDKLDFRDLKFSQYFMGYEDPAQVPTDKQARKAIIELTHVWDDEVEFYHNGNADPRGFGYIGLMVPNVYSVCERFAKLGVTFVKKPNDGLIKGLAIIKDPDGYWIKIFDAETELSRPT